MADGNAADVFETLADRLVAEALTDRLRRMPSMDEFRASDPQFFSREHWSFLTSGVDRRTFLPWTDACRWIICDALARIMNTDRLEYKALVS